MAYMEIRLYNYHDDDLLQIRLNGLDLGFIFTRASFAQSGIHSGLISPSTSYLSHLALSPVARQVPNTA